MFVVWKIHICYKDTMEGVWQKRVSQLLQRDICHKGVSHLLQGELKECHFGNKVRQSLYRGQVCMLHTR